MGNCTLVVGILMPLQTPAQETVQIPDLRLEKGLRRILQEPIRLLYPDDLARIRPFLYGVRKSSLLWVSNIVRT